MVGSNQAGEATAYLYNIDGIRIGKGDTSGQTLYTVDTNRDYAQVLAESIDGSIAVNYTYGDDLISQLRDNAVSTYHYDGLGSVRALSDLTGTLTDNYDYEAFGEVLNKTGDTENNYLFTGEQFDTKLNQYYLRARYYNHAVGRFTQMDTWQGVNSDPQTLHKYLYAHADPINNIDPTGNFSLGSISVGGSIQGVLTTVSIASTAFSIFSLATGQSEFSAKALATEILLARVGGPAAQRIINLMGKKSKALLKQTFDTVGCFFNSFPAETKVLTENGLVSIDEISIGDQVLSFNEISGEVEYNAVTHIISNEGNYNFVVITLGNGEVLEVTAEHPFYVDGDWQQANQLTISSNLVSDTGENLDVVSIARDFKEKRVFNLTVDNAHTYYVGEANVLVHNQNKNAGCKIRGRRAKGFQWEHILDRHSVAGNTARQRTRLVGNTKFPSHLTESQIRARVKGGWNNRELRRSQTDPQTGETRLFYEGVDEKSGTIVGFWFNSKTQIVESAFPR